MLKHQQEFAKAKKKKGANHMLAVMRAKKIFGAIPARTAEEYRRLTAAAAINTGSTPNSTVGG